LSELKNFGVKHKIIYQALLTWIKHDEANRKASFAELFKLLPFTRLSTTFLKSIILKETLVEENADCYALALEKLKLKLTGIEPTDQTKILSVGGEETGSKILNVYNDESDSSENIQYPDLPVKVCAHAIALFKNVLYCFGGCVNSAKHNFSQRVFALNLRNIDSGWYEVASMMCKIPDLRATVFQECIIVTGGYEFQQGHLNLVQMFITELNKWQKLPPMQVTRSGHGLVVCKGSLYAIGGKRDEETFEKSTERLDSLDEEWKQVSPLNLPRSFFAAVQCKGFIYALGGAIFGTKKVARVEKYDPAADQWSLIKNCVIPRFDHSACVMQGKIYVIGGSNRKSIVKEIECYDPIIDSWSIISTTRHQLHRFALFAV